MKRRVILIFCSILYFTITGLAQKTTNFVRNTDSTKITIWVDSVFNSLSLEEKVGQLFMPIVEPDIDWKDRTAKYINEQKVGGLLFSSGTMPSQARLTNYAQSITKTPLLISVDGEWGLSMRLKDAPKFQRNRMLGAIQNDTLIVWKRDSTSV
jgi:hypothetical protein